MDSEEPFPKLPSPRSALHDLWDSWGSAIKENEKSRHKCSACYKQYKHKEHLIEHMKNSFHSVHEPKCPVCSKHCKTFESLREHVIGSLAKRSCANIFSDQGCNLCLNLFGSLTSLTMHKETCCLHPPVPLETMKTCYVEAKIAVSDFIDNNHIKAVAIDCEMVAGGSDGLLDICARVCLIDEDENLLFHTYVQPQIPVVNYRYEVTGLTAEHLRNAMPLVEVQAKILQILYRGESINEACLDGGKARLVVGHELACDLESLKMSYPDQLLRDTAKYLPFMKTNLASHSLKYLTRKYLGYEIQSGIHDPYEDSVSAMRLYKKMRALDHPMEGTEASVGTNHTHNNSFSNPWNAKEIEKMTPDELYGISRSSYKCWCLDRGKKPELVSNI